MNKHHHDQLLPPCLQKIFTKKMTLSPLSHNDKLKENHFKLKNYRIKHLNDYDCQG
jgi:hypothetical protein